mmetsp:Transcript_15447/g.30978  ORF Transcript_15447/g.30978 Transcript_15447/m.30978 type:complete len:203 (+) Transcript_15447:130-738(+)
MARAVRTSLFYGRADEPEATAFVQRHPPCLETRQIDVRVCVLGPSEPIDGCFCRELLGCFLFSPLCHRLFAQGGCANWRLAPRLYSLCLVLLFRSPPYQCSRRRGFRPLSGAVFSCLPFSLTLRALRFPRLELAQRFGAHGGAATQSRVALRGSFHEIFPVALFRVLGNDHGVVAPKLGEVYGALPRAVLQLVSGPSLEQHF